MGSSGATGRRSCGRASGPHSGSRMSSGRFPAIALDRNGRPADTVTSNLGHLLGTGLLDPEETDAVVRRLARSDLDSGFGLRTMSAGEVGYNPLSYHCGSVWPHDTAIAIAGLAASPGPAAAAAARSLINGLLAAAPAFAGRLPELYGGQAGATEGRPVPYPISCRPQAWSAAASMVIVSGDPRTGGRCAGRTPSHPADAAVTGRRADDSRICGSPANRWTFTADGGRRGRHHRRAGAIDHPGRPDPTARSALRDDGLPAAQSVRSSRARPTSRTRAVARRA